MSALRQSFSLGLSVIAILIVSWGVFFNTSPHGVVSVETTATPFYDRVIETGKLRVSYIVFPPYISKDSATGEISGIFYDVVESLGRNLDLTVIWVEEVNLTNLSAGFETRRFDMIATPLWRSAERARNVRFSTPLFYSVVGTYVRATDDRFDTDINMINTPNITIAAIDGELAGEIAQSDFPEAKVSSLPQLVDYSQLLTEVVTGKADVTFYNTQFGRQFMDRNPGRIREIHSQAPVRVFAETFILPLNDEVFAEMIDSALLELLENNGLEKALSENGEDPTEYYRRARPYREPNNAPI